MADPSGHGIVGLVAGGAHGFCSPNCARGTDTWNYDNSKGINVVPWYNVEFDALAPPYIQHDSKAEDGFGDFSMTLKYRLATGNAERGDYSLSFSTTGTLPTGSYKNGSLAATIAPTLCGGKGFGRF